MNSLVLSSTATVTCGYAPSTKLRTRAVWMPRLINLVGIMASDWFILLALMLWVILLLLLDMSLGHNLELFPSQIRDPGHL